DQAREPAQGQQRDQAARQRRANVEVRAGQGPRQLQPAHDAAVDAHRDVGEEAAVAAAGPDRGLEFLPPLEGGERGRRDRRAGAAGRAAAGAPKSIQRRYGCPKTAFTSSTSLSARARPFVPHSSVKADAKPWPATWSS